MIMNDLSLFKATTRMAPQLILYKPLVQPWPTTRPTLERHLYWSSTKLFISHTCHTICFRLCSYDWMTSRLTIPRNSWLNNQLFMTMQLLWLAVILKMNCWFRFHLRELSPSFGQESLPYRSMNHVHFFSPEIGKKSHVKQRDPRKTYIHEFPIHVKTIWSLT